MAVCVHAIVIVVGLIALFHFEIPSSFTHYCALHGRCQALQRARLYAKLCNALACICCALDGRSKFFRVSSTCI
jgi:hypothetical protein